MSFCSYTDYVLQITRPTGPYLSDIEPFQVLISCIVIGHLAEDAVSRWNVSDLVQRSSLAIIINVAGVLSLVSQSLYMCELPFVHAWRSQGNFA